MDRTNYITGLQNFEGLSLRAICKKTGHHFNTVKKYVDRENWNTEIKPRKSRPSKLDPLKPIIDKWLRDDLKMPRKQRHTGTKVFNRLSDEHSDKLEVGMQTVINYVSKTKRELCKSVYDTAIWGYHPFGQAQLDFGEVYAYDDKGVMKKYYEIVLSFPASNAGFVQICKSQNQECLLEGMKNIFNHIGGVPARILFDNMSTAVAKIMPKHQRKLTDAFSRFVLHHKFRADFCNPNKGNEKGNVENKVGYKRRNYMVPVPTITDLKEFNENLFVICDNDIKREHYEKKELICDLFENDKSELLPLPAIPFKVTRLEKVKTDNYSFVRFENNRYGTSPEYKQCEMWLEISADEIRILNEKYEQVSVHQRIYELAKKPIIDWIPYLPAITKKPNAFKYTEFFNDLPEIWRDYFNQADFDDSKKMLNILSPIIIEGKLSEATSVMELVEVTDPDSFLASYRSLTESLDKPREISTPNMPKQTPYKNDLSVYDDLIGGEA